MVKRSTAIERLDSLMAMVARVPVLVMLSSTTTLLQSKSRLLVFAYGRTNTYRTVQFHVLCVQPLENQYCYHRQPTAPSTNTLENKALSRTRRETSPRSPCMYLEACGPRGFNGPCYQVLVRGLFSPVFRLFASASRRNDCCSILH